MASREELRQHFAQAFPLRKAAFGNTNSHVFFSRQTHEQSDGIGTLMVVDDKTGQVCPANYFGGKDANNRPYNAEQDSYPPNRDTYIYLGTEAQWRVDPVLSLEAINNNFKDMKECNVPVGEKPASKHPASATGNADKKRFPRAPFSGL